jgi:hypothetical protein
MASHFREENALRDGRAAVPGDNISFPDNVSDRLPRRDSAALAVLPETGKPMIERAHSWSALPLEVQLDLERRIEQLEVALQAGQRPALADFLPEEGSPGRGLCLIELVHADLN